MRWGGMEIGELKKGERHRWNEIERMKIYKGNWIEKLTTLKGVLHSPLIKGEDIS